MTIQTIQQMTDRHTRGQRLLDKLFDLADSMKESPMLEEVERNAVCECMSTLAVHLDWCKAESEP